MIVIIGKDELEYYINQGLSFQKIANKYNVSYTYIRNLCIKYKLQTKFTKIRNRDLSGQQYGRLTVIKQNGHDDKGRRVWLCKCSCEKQTEINVPTNRLISGNTKSCGCLASEIIIERNKNNKRYFSDKEKETIIQLYLNNHSIYYIREHFNLADYMVKEILDSRNIPLREKIIPFNENYFNIIDSEDKAYWLGFLYADGYIDNISAELSLQARDKPHIKKFLSYLDADIDIKDKIIRLNNKDYKSNRVLLNSKIFANDLINKGCTQNKSLTITFPSENILPLYLQNHFIRGFFDGDGCIGFYNNNQVNFGIISNPNFLLEVQKILVKQCNLNFVKLIKHHTSKQVKYLNYGGSHNVYRIYKYLYKNATVFLQRKYDKFQTFLNYYKNKYNILEMDYEQYTCRNNFG